VSEWGLSKEERATRMREAAEALRKKNQTAAAKAKREKKQSFWDRMKNGG
jgi:hypothetical protein